MGLFRRATSPIRWNAAVFRVAVSALAEITSSHSSARLKKEEWSVMKSHSLFRKGVSENFFHARCEGQIELCFALLAGNDPLLGYYLLLTRG